MSDNLPVIKRLSAGRVQCTVTFEEEVVRHAEDRAIQTLGASVTIDGFRPGKAPVALLRERIGDQNLLEETVRELLPGTIESLITTNGIKPMIYPKIQIVSRHPLSITATFVEKPAIKLKNADKIRVKKKEVAPDEEGVERMVRYLMNQHQTTADVDRAAKLHDKVTMDFWGEDEHGKEMEGTRSQGYDVVIGSKMLIPGFEDALVGLRKEEEKHFELTFPEQYQAEHLRNKKATFHVTVRRVEEVSVPELTDDMAKEKFGAESAGAFREQLRTSMRKQEEDSLKTKHEQEALEALRNATVVELAPELVDDEKLALQEELGKQLERHHLNIDQWLERTGKTFEQVDAEWTEQAKQRLTLRMGMEKFIEEKNVAVSDEDMDHDVKALLAPLSSDERATLEPSYQKGQRAYEQFRWQKTVEKALAMIIG